MMAKCQILNSNNNNSNLSFEVSFLFFFVCFRFVFGNFSRVIIGGLYFAPNWLRDKKKNRASLLTLRNLSFHWPLRNRRIVLVNAVLSLRSCYFSDYC